MLSLSLPPFLNTSAVPSCHPSSPHQPGCPTALLPAPVNSPPVTCAFACAVSGRKELPRPLGRPSFLQPCNDPPSARKKPNLTRGSYLGQRNAEMRQRKNVRRGIPGFCSLSEIRALIYTNRRVLIIDLQPPHPTHCHRETQPTAAIPTPTRLLQPRTEPDGTLPF